MSVSKEEFRKLNDYPSEGHKEAAEILSNVENKLKKLGGKLGFEDMGNILSVVWR